MLTGDADGVDRLVGDAKTVCEVFDSIPAYLVGYQGPEHTVVAINEQFRSLMGRTEFIGLPVREAMPDLAGQAVYEMFDHVYATGQTQVARDWRLQVRHGESGETRESFIDFVLTRSPEVDGRPTRLLAYAIDVTERVRERQAAQRAAAEAERRYRAARDVVVELQEALLPTALPVLPHVELAARYLVAAQDQAAGGDWFDVVPLPDGSLALVVGDVVGHGVGASAAMGQLRAVLDELLMATGDLEQALARVDRLAVRVPTMRAATLCVAVLNPAAEVLRYATCGQPPPLLVSPGGATRYLEASGGGPLGTGGTAPIATASVERDELLLLYSDGLVERPGRPLRDGMDLLAQVARDAAGNRALSSGAPASVAERVCEQAVELLTRTGYDDDVTVLAARLRPAPVESLQRALPARAASFVELRAAAADWLRQVDPDPRDARSLELAVSELVANAIEHAYPPHEVGQVRLSAALGNDGVAHIEVGDDGRWRTPAAPAATSGRGLWVTGAVVDELQLDHAGPSRNGTVATVRHRLHRPATLVSESFAAPDGNRDRAMDVSTTLDEGPPRVLRVTGRLDISTAPEFADRLSVASRGGVHPLVVDLTDVEVLASAGVSTLFTARAEHATHDTVLTIVAAPGSVPAQVLTPVGLEHAAGPPGEGQLPGPPAAS